MLLHTPDQDQWTGWMKQKQAQSSGPRSNLDEVLYISTVYAYIEFEFNI